MTPELLASFEEFKSVFNSSSLSAEALAEQMENVDQRIVDYAKTCKNGEMTTEGFKSSMEGISLKAKAAAIGTNLLKTALNAVANIGISLAINAIITGISKLVNSVNDAKEHIDQLSDESQKAQSDLENVAKKLEENEKLIDEINNNPLAITNENTLTRLENENIQLKAQYEYLKQIADLKKQELYKETDQFLNSANQKGTRMVTGFEGTVGAAQGGNWGKAISDSNLGIYSAGATILDSEKDLDDKAWDILKALYSIGNPAVWLTSMIFDTTEEAISYLDQADEYIDRLNEIKVEYESLDLSTEDGNNRKTQLDNELDELKSKIATNGSYLSKQISEGNIDETSDTYSRITGIMQRTTEALNQFNDVEIDLSDTKTEIEDTGNSVEDLFEKSKVLKESLDSTFSDQSTIQSAFDKIQQGSSLSADEVRKLIGVCPELASAFTKTADGYTIDSERLVEANNKITSSSRQSLEEQLTSLKELKANLEEQLNTPIVYSNNRSYQDIREEYGKTQDELAKTEEAIAEVELSLSMLGIRNNSVINAFEKLDESFTNLTSKAKTLSSALQEQDEAGTLSADTIMNIVDAGYASALVFDQVTGKVTLNKEAYLQLAKAEYDEQIANLEMLRTFYETNEVLSNITSNTNGAIGSIYGIASAFLELQKSISDTPEQIAEIDARIAALKTARDNVGNYGTTGDGTDSAREDFEAAMKEKEHLHNMGLISDKKYYDALEEANETYYKDSLEHQSEYNSNVEKIYNGRKNIYKEDVDNQVQALQEAYDKGFITAQELKSKLQQLAETKYGIGTIYYGTEFASENYDDLTDKAKDIGYDIYKEKLDELKKADDGSLESHQKFIEKWKKLAAKMFEGVDPKKYQEILDEIEKEDEDFLEDYKKKQEDAWNERVEKEKEYWENQKQAVVDYYDEEIKKLEDIADEEERINKQEELRLNLIKAQQDLLNAKKNRNQLVFANGGFEYTYDQEAVESASEAVKNAEKDIADYNRDQEINLLKEQKENEEKYYDQILKIIDFYIKKSIPLAESDQEVLDEIMNSPYTKYATQGTEINPIDGVKPDTSQEKSKGNKGKSADGKENGEYIESRFVDLKAKSDLMMNAFRDNDFEGIQKVIEIVGEQAFRAAQYPMWGHSINHVYDRNNVINNNNNNDNKSIHIGDIHVNVQGGTSDEMINEFSQKLSAALAECATREIYSKNNR